MNVTPFMALVADIVTQGTPFRVLEADEPGLQSALCKTADEIDGGVLPRDPAAAGGHRSSVFLEDHGEGTPSPHVVVDEGGLQQPLRVADDEHCSDASEEDDELFRRKVAEVESRIKGQLEVHCELNRAISDVDRLHQLMRLGVTPTYWDPTAADAAMPPPCCHGAMGCPAPALRTPSTDPNPTITTAPTHRNQPRLDRVVRPESPVVPYPVRVKVARPLPRDDEIIDPSSSPVARRSLSNAEPLPRRSVSISLDHPLAWRNPADDEAENDSVVLEEPPRSATLQSDRSASVVSTDRPIRVVYGEQYRRPEDLPPTPTSPSSLSSSPSAVDERRQSPREKMGDLLNRFEALCNTIELQHQQQQAFAEPSDRPKRRLRVTASSRFGEEREALVDFLRRAKQRMLLLEQRRVAAAQRKSVAYLRSKAAAAKRALALVPRVGLSQALDDVALAEDFADDFNEATRTASMIVDHINDVVDEVHLFDEVHPSDEVESEIRDEIEASVDADLIGEEPLYDVEEEDIPADDEIMDVDEVHLDTVLEVEDSSQAISPVRPPTQHHVAQPLPDTFAVESSTVRSMTPTENSTPAAPRDAHGVLRKPSSVITTSTLEEYTTSSRASVPRRQGGAAAMHPVGQEEVEEIIDDVKSDEGRFAAPTRTHLPAAAATASSSQSFADRSSSEGTEPASTPSSGADDSSSSSMLLSDAERQRRIQRREAAELAHDMHLRAAEFKRKRRRRKWLTSLTVPDVEVLIGDAKSYLGSTPSTDEERALLQHRSLVHTANTVAVGSLERILRLIHGDVASQLDAGAAPPVKERTAAGGAVLSTSPVATMMHEEARALDVLDEEAHSTPSLYGCGSDASVGPQTPVLVSPDSAIVKHKSSTRSSSETAGRSRSPPEQQQGDVPSAAAAHLARLEMLLDKFTTSGWSEQQFTTTSTSVATSHIASTDTPPHLDG